MQFEETYSFDDVLMVPQFSNIKSRADVDLSVELSKGINLKFGIIPANMKTISGKEMCTFIASKGGMALLHRFMPIEEQLQIIRDLFSINNDYTNHIGVSIGAKSEDIDNIDKFIKLGVKIICIDVAHGHNKAVIDICHYIYENYPDVFLIAGNVATASGAFDLWEAGADCVKVGIGPGSLCSTRIETGHGVAQLSAIIDVFNQKKNLEDYYKNNYDTLNRKLFIIADGGIKSAGDCTKAFAFADLVMSGALFSGTDQASGELININGKQYKSYVGSSTHKTNHIEGVASFSEYNGDADKVLSKLTDGITSGCSYSGARNLTELKVKAKFVKVTNAGLVESRPHHPGIIK